jgi:hypothetical protein
MSKRKVWSLVVLVALVAPIAFLVASNWVLVKYLLRDIPYFGDQFEMIDPSKEIQHIKIGDYVADIPSNYFWRNYVFNGAWWHTSPDRLEGNVFNIEVTWPGLKPWSPETNELFREPGSPQTLSVSFGKMKNEDWPFNYFKNYRQDLKLIIDSKEAPGLLHFKDMTVDQDIYLEYDEPKRGMIKIICSSRDSEIPSPSCTCRHSVFMDKYHIKYTFHRRYLSDWREIDTGLKDLFFSFIVSE